MRRRTFLGGVGAAVGVTAAAGLWRIQPRGAQLVAASTGPRMLPGDTPPPHVVVVGGGLAGISTATTLAERGFKVTLLEGAPFLGGKVSAWTTEVLGEVTTVEHGFHGYFHQYATLRDLLRRANALTPAHFQPAYSYPIAFADRPTEVFGTQTALFPLNLLDVIRQSPSLKFMEFRDADALLDLCRYDGANTYARFDDVDFATWCRTGKIPPAMVDLILRPFSETTLNRMERLSTAEAFKFFHFYFTGSPTGLGFDLGLADSHTAVVGPLVARLAALGVDVRTEARVHRLHLDDGAVAGVILSAPSGTSDTTNNNNNNNNTDADAAVRLHPLPTGPAEARGAMSRFVSLTVDGAPYLADRQRGVATDLRCTHQGCPVQPQLSDDQLAGYHCPCHGGRYDVEGTPVAGPPKRALRTLAIVDDAVLIPIRPPEERLQADAVVVACDTAGTRGILERSDLASRVDTRALREAEPFCVARFWLDTPTNSDRAAFYTTSRFRYLDSLAIYSAFQAEAVEWAKEHQGSVVEVHAYAIAEDDLRSAGDLADAMWLEALTVLSELHGARVLHREVQLQQNFTRFAPGDYAHRLQTVSVVDNLLFAGDWVRVDAPVALMEGAVVSGRLAANHLLKAAGLVQEPIDIVAPRGPLA